MYDKKFLVNLPLGVFIGSVAVLALCAAFDADISEDITTFYVFIFSALTALFAASVALSGVLANLNQQEKQRQQDRARKLLTAKSFLPIALSEMCSVAMNGLNASWDSRQPMTSDQRDAFFTNSLNEIQLSDEIVSVFRDIIQYSSDQSAERIQGILREYQVFSARWRGLALDRHILTTIDNSELAQRTAAWAYLYALTSSAFDFARGEAFEITTSVGEDEIRSAFNVSNCYPHSQLEFDEAIAMYARNFGRRFPND